MAKLLVSCLVGKLVIHTTACTLRLSCWLHREHSGLASHASGASSTIADTVAALSLQSRVSVSPAPEPAERWERGHIQPG